MEPLNNLKNDVSVPPINFQKNEPLQNEIDSKIKELLKKADTLLNEVSKLADLKEKNQTTPEDPKNNLLQNEIDSKINELLRKAETLLGKTPKAETQQEQQNINDSIITYKKGEIPTKNLVPSKKEHIGSGSFSKVYELDVNKLKENSPNSDLLITNTPLVIKKGSIEEEEFRIGKTLNHKNIVKSHNFFIKERGNGKAQKKMVIDRVFGKDFSLNTGDSLHKLENDVIKKCIQTTKEVSLYLFDKGIYWGDVNQKNMFIEEGSEELKFFDFGFWAEESDVEVRTFRLLMNSIKTVCLFLQCSKFFDHHYDLEKNNLSLSRILFPLGLIKTTFKDQVDFFPMKVITDIYYDLSRAKTDDNRFQPFWEKIKACEKNNEKLKKYLSSYFIAVLTQFEIEIPNQKK